MIGSPALPPILLVGITTLMSTSWLLPKARVVVEFQLCFLLNLAIGYGDTSSCCPLPLPLPLPCAAQIQCLYCEFMGTRIVHPVGIDFHGGELEFEKMACGKDPWEDDSVPIQLSPYSDNMNIINHRFCLAESIYGSVKEDSLYDDLDGHKIEEYDMDLGSMSIDAGILLLANNI